MIVDDSELKPNGIHSSYFKDPDAVFLEHDRATITSHFDINADPNRNKTYFVVSALDGCVQGLVLEEKRKRKKKQFTFLTEESSESQSFYELVAVLEDLEKEGKYVDVQICPRCKSPRVRRLGSMSGNLWGHMGIYPDRFECKECGWSERLVLKVTNRLTSIRDAEIIAEASDTEKET
jgi:hypothetical protein